MFCKDLELDLTDFIDNNLSEKRRLEFEQHLEVCQNCRVKLNETKQTIEYIKGLSEIEPPNDFSLKIIKAIEFEEIKGSIKRTKSFDFVSILKWSGAAAAIFFVLFGIFDDRLQLNYAPDQVAMQARTFVEEMPVEEILPASESARMATFDSVESKEETAVEDNLPQAANYLTAEVTTVESDLIELKVFSAATNINTLRVLAEENNIEILDITCEGLTLRVNEEKRKLLFGELSKLGEIVETGKQLGSDMLSIVIIY